MPVASDGVALGRVSAGQEDIGVWVRRTVSAKAWSHCHLACHWLPYGLPAGGRAVRHRSNSETDGRLEEEHQRGQHCDVDGVQSQVHSVLMSSSIARLATLCIR